MSNNSIKRYTFEKRTHFQKCRRFGGAKECDDNFLSIATPFGQDHQTYGSSGAFSPACSSEGEVFWKDNDGNLHRLSSLENHVTALNTPDCLAKSQKLVVTVDGIWALSSVDRLLCLYDKKSLTRKLRFELSIQNVVSIASDQNGFIVAMGKQHDGWILQRINPSGQIVQTINLKLDSKCQPQDFFFQKGSKSFVIALDNLCPQLLWLDENAKQVRMKSIGQYSFGFRYISMYIGEEDRIFVLGIDRTEDGGRHRLLSLDREGNLSTSSLVLDSTPQYTGIVEKDSFAFLTCSDGLKKFAPTGIIPSNGQLIQCVAVTPKLFSPPENDQKSSSPWLRAEAEVTLPNGCSFEIGCFDSQTMGKQKIESKGEKNNQQEFSQSDLNQLISESSQKVIMYGESSGSESRVKVRLKLFDTQSNDIFVWAKLIASPGAKLPAIRRLDVLYPGISLGQYLPSFFRRNANQSGDFLRSFIGILETSSQDIDEKISRLGDHLNPKRASEDWLNYVARWLGIPWDDEIGLYEKRNLVTKGHLLLKNRGTKVGLEILLENLIPGSLRRFKVSDPFAKYGFTYFKHGSNTGLRLPALLPVITKPDSACDSLLEERTREVSEQTGNFLSPILVEIAANPFEKQKWQPWIKRVIDEMIPLNCCSVIQWIPWVPFDRNSGDRCGSPTSKNASALGFQTVLGKTELPPGQG